MEVIAAKWQKLRQAWYDDDDWKQMVVVIVAIYAACAAIEFGSKAVGSLPHYADVSLVLASVLSFLVYCWFKKRSWIAKAIKIAVVTYLALAVVQWVGPLHGHQGTALLIVTFVLLPWSIYKAHQRGYKEGRHEGWKDAREFDS